MIYHDWTAWYPSLMMEPTEPEDSNENPIESSDSANADDSGKPTDGEAFHSIDEIAPIGGSGRRITIMVEDAIENEYQVYELNDIDLFAFTRYASSMEEKPNYLFELKVHTHDDVIVRDLGNMGHQEG